MLTKFRVLAAPEVVKMIISGSSSVDNFIIIAVQREFHEMIMSQLDVLYFCSYTVYNMCRVSH